MLNQRPSIYSSICLSIYFSQASPCSMCEDWVCHDQQPSTAEGVRHPSHPHPPVTASFGCSVSVAGPVTSTSTTSSLVNSRCGSVSSPSDALRCTSSVPCSQEWSPVNAAAHLHLLGEALSLIGLHLKGTNVSTILFCFFAFKNPFSS